MPIKLLSLQVVKCWMELWLLEDSLIYVKEKKKSNPLFLSLISIKLLIVFLGTFWSGCYHKWAPPWRSWILSCVRSVAASILINGSPTIPFKLHRGLCLGDPLSPFLFNLVVESLSLIIQKAMANELWEGVEISRGGMKISHLQYADDTIIFYPPNMEYLLIIEKVQFSFI